MNLSSLSAADLKRLTKLLEKRDALKERVETLNAQIDGYSLSGKTTTSKAKAKPGPKGKGKRAGRGKLTESVVAALKEAGAGGITVTEIAKKVGRNAGAIHTWFFNAKKAKRKDVKKVGAGKWQWVG